MIYLIGMCIILAFFFGYKIYQSYLEDEEEIKNPGLDANGDNRKYPDK